MSTTPKIQQQPCTVQTIWTYNTTMLLRRKLQHFNNNKSSSSSNIHSQRFYNLLYNKFATWQCQSPTSRHVKKLRCGKFLSVVQQVVEML